MSPEAAAERGAYERMKEDAQLASLLGPGVRIIPDWPHDQLDERHCPRVTFYVLGPAPVARGVARARLALDLWVWPSGANGGRTRLLDIDRRLVELFDERDWVFAGHWIVARAGAFRDFPAAPTSPMRRHREIMLDVARTAA